MKNITWFFTLYWDLIFFDLLLRFKNIAQLKVASVLQWCYSMSLSVLFYDQDWQNSCSTLQIKKPLLKLNQSSTHLPDLGDAWTESLWIISLHQFLLLGPRTRILLLKMSIHSLPQLLVHKVMLLKLRASLCLAQIQIAVKRLER